MSLLSLADIGIYRDQTPLGQTINARAKLITATPASRAAGTAPPGAADAADAGSVANYGKLLTAQIPGEALLAYTTLLALFPDRDSNYQIGRWIIYFASLAACAATVIGAYLAKRIDNTDEDTSTGRPRKLPRHLPYFPASMAVFAMATYGLTVPGSALQQSMDAPSFAIVAGCLAVGGGVVMFIITPFLGKGNTVPVKPDHTIVLSAGDQPPAGTHTVIATLTQSGSPLSDQPVSFTVTGRNAGVAGTCNPPSGQTDTNGTVSFTYHNTNTPRTNTIDTIDTIDASVTISGTTRHATASKIWT